MVVLRKTRKRRKCCGTRKGESHARGCGKYLTRLEKKVDALMKAGRRACREWSDDMAGYQSNALLRFAAELDKQEKR